MISLDQTLDKSMSGNVILTKRTWNLSPESSMNGINGIRPKRNQLLLNPVLPVPWTIVLLWLDYPDRSPKILIHRSLGSPFGDSPNNLPTRPAPTTSLGLKTSIETDLISPLHPTGMTPETKDKGDKKKTPKALLQHVPSIEEVGGADAAKAGNRTGPPPLPIGVTQQQQSSRPSTRCAEAPPLPGHRGGNRHDIAGLLQPLIPSAEAGWYLPSHNRLKETQSVHCRPFIQDGDSLFDNSSSSTQRVDNEDRFEGRIPSYPGTCQHQEILPVCRSRNSIPIPGPPIRTFNSSERIHQDPSSCCSSITFSRHPGTCISGRLDNSCSIQRTKSSPYSACSTTSSVTGMDNKLGQVNVTAFPNPGLSGPPLQLRTSPNISSGLVLTYSHRSPLPSISVDGHVCSQGFIHYQPDVTLCPIYNQRPSSSTFPPTLVQRTMDSTSSVMGHSNPSGLEVPLLPPLVSPSIRDDRSTVTSSGPQSLLLHGCIPQRLGSQLEESTDLRSLVKTRIPTSHQLAGIRGRSSSPPPLGPPLEQSDSPGLLRQQYGSSVHPQTRRHSFTSPVSQDSGIIPITGSICDNTHTHTSPRSSERHRRCSVSSQSTQPNGMASSNRNLEQTVLCLRDSPDRYVRHSGEQSDAHLRFSLPRRQSMGGRRPDPILGRFGPNLRISSGSHCAQDDPENTEIPRHHGHSDSVSTPVTTVASSVAPVEHTSQDSPDRRSPIPVCAQPPAASVPQRSQTIGSSRVALIRDVLKRHRIPDPVLDMAADPLRDSSSHVYNSHWKAFAIWANEKGLHPNDLSFITLAEYLVHLFSQNKKVNTILVHKASISSMLKLLNPPTALPREHSPECHP